MTEPDMTKHDAVDIHAHAVMDTFLAQLPSLVPELAPTIEEDGEQRFVTVASGRRFGPLPVGMFQSTARLVDMDHMGLKHQAISAPPWMFNYGVDPGAGAEVVRACNDSMVAFAEDEPERISVLAGLPLQDPRLAVDEIERVAANRAVRGVAIGTVVAGVNLDDDRFNEVWEAIEANDLAVLVHPTDPAARERLEHYYLINLIGNPLESAIAIASLVFGGVIARFPEMRVCFVHGGGFAPYQLGRWRHGWELRPESKRVIDRSPDVYFRRLYFDSLTHDPASLQFLIDQVGVDQIMLGSDYMFQMGDHAPIDSLLALKLSDEAMGKILNENSLRFLRPR